MPFEKLLPALLATTILVACGGSGPRSEPPPEAGEAGAVPGAVAGEAAPPEEGRLVLIDAVADQDVYELGEPVTVRRVYENVGGTPVRVTTRDWGGRALGQVVITSSTGSRLYEPSSAHLEEVVVEPGTRTENRIAVELPVPGDYTIEVPPEYVARGARGACFRLRVTVLDRADARIVTEKAERLARVIEKEDPDCPTCWSPAQSDLKALGPAAVPHLRRWLRESENAHLRAIAAKLLWFVKGTEGVDDLVAALEDEDPHVRKMCLDSLGSFRRPETLDGILPLAKDPDPWVRVEFVETIAVFDDARVVTALRAALTDADEFVRRWAAIHLAEEKADASGIHVLIRALETDPARETFLVVPALEKLTDRSFGEPTMPFIHSSTDAIEEAVATNEILAKRWLAWWQTDGRARFGDD